MVGSRGQVVAVVVAGLPSRKKYRLDNHKYILVIPRAQAGGTGGSRTIALPGPAGAGSREAEGQREDGSGGPNGIRGRRCSGSSWPTQPDRQASLEMFV